MIQSLERSRCNSSQSITSRDSAIDLSCLEKKDMASASLLLNDVSPEKVCSCQDKLADSNNGFPTEIQIDSLEHSIETNALMTSSSSAVVSVSVSTDASQTVEAKVAFDEADTVVVDGFEAVLAEAIKSIEAREYEKLPDFSKHSEKLSSKLGALKASLEEVQNALKRSPDASTNASDSEIAINIQNSLSSLSTVLVEFDKVAKTYQDKYPSKTYIFGLKVATPITALIAWISSIQAPWLVPLVSLIVCHFDLGICNSQDDQNEWQAFRDKLELWVKQLREKKDMYDSRKIANLETDMAQIKSQLASLSSSPLLPAHFATAGQEGELVTPSSSPGKAVLESRQERANAVVGANEARFNVSHVTTQEKAQLKGLLSQQGNNIDRFIELLWDKVSAEEKKEFVLQQSKKTKMLADVLQKEVSIEKLQQLVSEQNEYIDTLTNMLEKS